MPKDRKVQGEKVLVNSVRCNVRHVARTMNCLGNAHSFILSQASAWKVSDG